MVAPILEAPPSVRRRTNGLIPPSPPPTGGGDGHDDDPSPRRPVMDNALLATLFLIGGEIMIFAGLISAFWVLRVSAPVWPPPLQPRLPVGVTGANTVILFSSSAMIFTRSHASPGAPALSARSRRKPATRPTRVPGALCSNTASRAGFPVASMGPSR